MSKVPNIQKFQLLEKRRIFTDAISTQIFTLLLLRLFFFHRRFKIFKNLTFRSHTCTKKRNLSSSRLRIQNIVSIEVFTLPSGFLLWSSRCASVSSVHGARTYVCHRGRRERKEGSWQTRSFSWLVTWPLVGVCLTFSMAVGKDGSMAGGPRPPPPATHLLPPLDPRIPSLRRSPTQANVNYRRLWIILRRFQTAPGLLLFESTSRCPFFSLSPPFTFFLRRQPVILVWPSFLSSSRVRKTYVSHRTLPEKRQAAPIDGRGMCSGPYSHLARPGPRQ